MNDPRLDRGGSFIRRGVIPSDATEGLAEPARNRKPGDVIKDPQLVGMTADIAHRMKASWISTLFNYQPPCFGFTRSEQRLLICALDGGTDEEISNRLCVSSSAVKKTWRSVHQRMDVSGIPGFPQNPTCVEGKIARGKGKKNHLLTYLREHPEELRPYSRRLLEGRAGAPRHKSQ